MFEITFDESWKRKMMDEEQLSQEELSAKEKELEKWVRSFMGELTTPNYLRVEFHPYRTKSVSDEIFDADRESMFPLEYMLAIKAGVNPFNHTCYEVEFGREKIYFMCQDNLFRVGRKILPW